jgi:uncharacterized protein (TIGR02145 family)
MDIDFFVRAMKNQFFINQLIIAGLILFLTASCKKKEEPDAFTMTDKDGNVYTSVTIGTQTWLAENLKTTTYNDGSDIPNVIENSAWITLTAGAYCDYANNPANSDTYGRLYNWYVAAPSNTKKICPTGWHVPKDEEWTTMINYLGGTSVAGGMLKETGILHWAGQNAGATNETGFTALPGGYRSAGDGAFSSIGNLGFWWSASDAKTTAPGKAWYVVMHDFLSTALRFDKDKEHGLSIRCVKD